MKKKKEIALFANENEGLLLYFAWAIAVSGVWLSVFFGEILQHEPCPLCWYQRIALFPLAILLGIAAYRSDAKIVSYALPLAILGTLAALLQLFEHHFPALQKAGVCNLGESCSQPIFTLFSFLNFPALSAMGFSLIAALLFLVRKKPQSSSDI